MKPNPVLPLLRLPGDLILLERVQLPARGRLAHACDFGTTDSGWRVRRRSAVKAALPAGLRGTVAAWQGLATATRSPATLADLLMVLMTTRNSSGAGRAVPRLERGPADIREALCHPAAVRALLDSLANHRPAALGLLRRRGVDVRSLREESSAIDRTSEGGQASIVVNGLLPWLRGSEPAPVLVKAWLDLLRSSDADREGLLATILVEGNPGWLPVMAALAPETRSAVLRLLVESGAMAVVPPARVHRLFTAVHRLSDARTWRTRANWACRALVAGADPGYLAACLRWHLQHDLHLPEDFAGSTKPSRRLLQLMMQRGCRCLTGEPATVWRFLSSDALASAGVRLILGRATRQPRWQMDLLCLLAGTEPASTAEGWKRTLFLQQLPAFLGLAANLRPASRRDCWQLIENWINDAPAPYPDMAGDMMFWLRRTASGPISLPHKASHFLVACLARLDPEGRALLRTLPDEDLKRLARRASGWGFGWNICDALESGEIPPYLLGWALRYHLKGIIDILLALGDLPAVSVRRVWQSMAGHPLISCQPRTMALTDALILLDSVADGHEGLPPLPDSVRRLIARRDPGDASRCAEARTLVEGLWWRLAVAVLDRLVKWEVARGYPGLRDQGVDFHTLRMARHNTDPDSNAAAYRSILRASSAGHATRAWALELPRNRRWLREHPEARHAAWQEGFPVIVSMEKLGGVTLSFEDDLQEILRMGTRFDTCLSVGGCNSHSPAAVALDANKRVLYARDARGKVLARQLLAISEDRALVCFSVYAHREEKDLRNAFSSYDLMLAQVLGLTLWQSREDYNIARIVCRNWYDDGAWTFWKDHVDLAS